MKQFVEHGNVKLPHVSLSQNTFRHVEKRSSVDAVR